MLVDRVIQALNEDRGHSAFPNLDPIGPFGDSMLFSENYEEDREWSVNYSFNGVWGAIFYINSVQLSHNGYDVDLTKDQKKRLTAAYLPAIKRVQDKWKARKQQAGL